jgi:phosphonate transport system permease protein
MSHLPAPDPAQLRARYPDVFERPASARLATPAMALLAFGIFIFGLNDLDFSPARLVKGLHELGWITVMMLPPDPGSSLPLYLKALGETLSIALLGTTLAAIPALPVSLFAARNIVPEILRFPVRRFLDTIRGVDTLIWALAGSMSSASGRLPACWPSRCRISAHSANCSRKPSRPPTESRSRVSALPVAARCMKSASG